MRGRAAVRAASKAPCSYYFDCPCRPSDVTVRGSVSRRLDSSQAPTLTTSTIPPECESRETRILGSACPIAGALGLGVWRPSLSDLVRYGLAPSLMMTARTDSRAKTVYTAP